MSKWLIALMALLLTGCSMSGNIMDETLVKPEVSFNREAPDTIYGEAVTTSNNYEIRAAVGEISEKKTTSNNYQIEGVFYQ